MPVVQGPNVISVFTKAQLPPQFVTDNGIDEVVTVKEGHPGPEQTWFVQAVNGKPDVYTITVGTFPPKLGTPGFRRERERDPDYVLNSPLRGEWRFVPVPDFPDVFEVHPNDHIIGVIELLGTRGAEVVIEIFPLVPGEPFAKPAWRFIPIL